MTHLNSSFIPSSGREASLRWHPWLKTVSLKQNQKSPFFLLTKCLTSAIFACWLHFEKVHDNVSVITGHSFLISRIQFVGGHLGRSQACPLALPSLPQQLLRFKSWKLYFQSLHLATFQRSRVSYYTALGNWFLGNLSNGWETERENSKRPCKTHIQGHSLSLRTRTCLKVGSASLSISSRTIGKLSNMELFPTRCLNRK